MTGFMVYKGIMVKKLLLSGGKKKVEASGSFSHCRNVKIFEVGRI